MKLTWSSVVSFVLSLTFCICSISGSNDNIPESFGQGLPPNSFQSWNDWLAKRDLNYAWEPTDLSGWHDWMYKRGYFSPPSRDNLGLFDKSKFQEWKAWISKRTPGFSSPVSRFNPFDKGQFQQWNDWVSKRYFDMGATDFGPLFRPDFQNWQDFVKRQGFMFPSLNVGAPGATHFQNWQDWINRAGSSHQIGNKDRFIKRQLGFIPDRYSSFRRYFTDGLQDWRSTFRGIKRGKNQIDKKAEEQ